MKKFSFKGLATHHFLLLLAVTPAATAQVPQKAPLSATQQQQNKVTGTITDANGALPSVTVTNGNQTATSNAYGKYAITASPTDTLTFTSIGYKTQHIAARGNTTVNVRMQPETTTLKEVTVNAGYYTVKESERTGSITKITAKDIEKQPVTNVLATMQGRMAGVSITQETGVPGGGFDIKIRGQNSLRANGNAPLFIVDGVPYSSDPIGHSQVSTTIPGDASPLNSINPSDIESLEVLKDADATAIYGSRGANGVVLITTKKGKKGKTAYAVSASTGVGNVTRMVKLLHTEDYLAIRRQAFANDGITEYPEDAYDVNGTWDQTRYTDWQKELIGGTAEITNLQASVSGGSEQTSFMLSGNTNKQTTVFPGTFNYKKGGAHLSIGHTSTDKKFHLDVTANYTAQDNDQPATDFTREARYLPPNAPALYDASGNLNWENSTWSNPLRNLSAKALAKTRDLVANTVLSYELPYHFTIKSSFGYSDTRHNESRTNPSTLFDPAFGVKSSSSSIFVNNTTRSSWIAEPQLNWNKTFGKAKVDVLLGSTFQSQLTNRLVERGLGFTSNSLIYDLASATSLRIYTNEELQYKYQAFFGRLNVGYNDRYFLNLTGRRDGSSRFGTGNRFANFGAIGGAWVFSKEKVFEEQAAFLSFGKLRASYGITGNDQIGDYQFLDTYQSTGTNYDGSIGLTPTRLFNPDFGWESNKKTEVAIDLGFFNDRIVTSVASYKNRSSSQLVGIPLAGTTGFTTMQANLDATVENTGTEITLRTTNIQKGNFSWVTNFNLTLPKNKLVSFPGLEESTYKNQFVIGESINIKKLYHYTGIDPQTGVYTFEDINGDGEITLGDDNQIVRDFSPEYFGGIQNQFSYKGWQLDFLFQFVKQMNFNPVSLMGFPGTMENVSVTTIGSWQQPGDNAANQIYTTGLNDAAVNAYDQYASSDAAVSDASYIRLKNIQLSYELPQRRLSDIRCKITAQAQNLLTITSYKGADPEFRDPNYLPPLRIISAGVQLNF